MSFANEALRLRALGFHPIAERPNSKLPAAGAWQTYINRSDEQLLGDFGPDHGIGTVTHGFVVIDLDVREDKNGIDALRDLPPLPTTLTSKTPSGGRHLFFRIPAGLEIRNSVSKVGPGIDVRGTGGQVVLPPTVINGKAYEWDSGGVIMAELPASWLKLLTEEPAKTAKATPLAAPRTPASSRQTVRALRDIAHEAERRAHYMAQLDQPSIQGSGGNAVMMTAAFRAKGMSRNTGEALAALLEWNERLASPPWSEHDLLRAIQNSEASFGEGLDREKPGSDEAPRAPAQDVAWVEAMQAYVARDPSTGTWDLGNPLGERAALMALISRGMPSKDAKEALRDCAVTIARRVECDPTQGPTFRQDNQLVLNNYIPSAVRPAPPSQGSATHFPVLAEVIGFLTSGEPTAKKWLLNWLAFAVQNPARQMRTVPVLYGAQGTGKSLIARAMQALLGEMNSATIRNEDIKSKFTSHFVSKLFLVVGEIEAGEVAHATSTLKYLTGEPQLVFEAKGSAAFFVPNRIKMLATSNQTLPVTLEGEADSRWVLFKQMTPPPADYSARMASLFDQATNQWNEKGRLELSAFLAYLLAYPVDVQLARSVHVNDARASAIEASRSSVEQFVEAVSGSSLDAVWVANIPDYERAAPSYDHMDFPGHEHLTGAAAIYATYRAFCRSSGLNALGTGRFPGELERHATKWKRHRVSPSVSATRPWAYTGVPRERRLRLSYLPPEMRQSAMKLPERKAEPSKQIAMPAGGSATATAIANIQSIFGDTDAAAN